MESGLGNCARFLGCLAEGSSDNRSERGVFRPLQPGSPHNLWNGGTLEKAAAIANDASTRTTQLYEIAGATSSASMRLSES